MVEVISKPPPVPPNARLHFDQAVGFNTERRRTQIRIHRAQGGTTWARC